MSRPSTIVLARVAVAVASAGAALLGAELAIRWLAPVPQLFPQWQWDALPTDWRSEYEVDSDIGYRPVLGSGEYTKFGTVRNEYPVDKAAGVTRVLFLGDSVTHRWRIQRVFVNRCAGQPVEFWNAGVEGFNTGQQVEYYLRWNRRIEPDHVTLLFHNNDFVATPVAFRDDQGQLTIANPQAYLSRRDVDWAARSHLYRHYLRIRTARAVEEDPITSVAETREALAKLKAALDAEGVGFNVILVPVLKPLAEWTEYESRSRSASLEIFGELGVPVFDLIHPLTEAAERGLDLHETPGDIWHPNDEISRRFARHAIRKGYLEVVLPPDGCPGAT
ncbi:MAG: hypothetical protein ACE5GX_16335 [Thermoanaerobaculia bacterium]